MSVQTYFEKIATDFDSYYEKPESWFQNLTNEYLRKPALLKRLKLSLENLNKKPNQRILDIGCGSGVLAIPLAEQGHKVTGVDFSEAMIELAKNKANQANVEVDYQVKDFIDGNFGNYDACIALGVMEYFKNPYNLVEKMFTSCNPGGLVIYDIPSLFNYHTPIRLPYLLWRKRKVYFYTKKKAYRMVKPFEAQAESIDFLDYGAGYLAVIKKNNKQNH